MGYNKLSISSLSSPPAAGSADVKAPRVGGELWVDWKARWQSSQGAHRALVGSASRRLAEEGAKVLIADIDVSASEANVENIRAAGGVADSLRADLGVHDDIKTMIDRATELWGRLDILVNNAYSPAHGGGQGGALEVTEEAWDAGMGLLVKSIFPGRQVRRPGDAEDGGRQH